MKNPETPIESLRSLLPQTEVKGTFEPKYVDLPTPKVTAGGLNLRWGIVFLSLSLIVLAAAGLLAGPRALLPLITCLLTMTVLWILARMNVFKQRNGGFFALGVLSLFGSLLAVAEWGYARLAQSPWVSGVQVAHVETTRETTRETTKAHEKASEKAPEPAMLLSQLVGIKQPQEIAGAKVKILEAQTVSVGRKVYRVEPGEFYKFLDLADGMVGFAADELRVSVPSETVEVVPSNGPVVVGESELPKTPPAPPLEDESPEKVTVRAQKEAVRRFPALGTKDSPENLLFVETFKELKNTGSEMLKDAEWPLHLAESLAKREGWQRADAQ